MATCTRCAKEIGGFETISVTGRGDFCYACYNDDLIQDGFEDFDNAKLDPVVLEDADGVAHTFAIQSLIVPTGHGMKAVEVRDGEARGYVFEILGDFGDDALVLFGKLYQRMRAGLAQRHIERGAYGWELTDAARIVGRIEADLDDPDGLPLLVVDGKELTWEEVGRMLKSSEGFTLEMAVKDSIEVVGGPLLEEARAK